MSSTNISRAANVWLWVAQGLLALLFLFTGVLKLVMPAQVLAQQSAFPVGFMRFVAVAELCGALGLVLPGMLGFRRELTPLAALGLIVIMAGATTATVATQSGAFAVLPLVVGILLGVVLWGRRSWLSR